jgi:hypothetical protein
MLKSLTRLNNIFDIFNKKLNVIMLTKIKVFKLTRLKNFRKTTLK